MKRPWWMLFAALLLVTVLSGATCPKSGQDLGSAGPEDIRQAEKTYQDAEELYESGDHENALALYRQIIKDYPSTKAARHARFRAGQAELKLGNTERALEMFKSYSNLYEDGSELSKAQDYVIKILSSKLDTSVVTYKRKLAEMEEQLFRHKMLNRSLRRSVDAETIYIEIDLQADRLLVKLGTQPLYEYPVVTGKGRTKVHDFSTPVGVFQVESMIEDPVWYRPDWVWTERGLEVPEDITLEERGLEGVLGPWKLGIGQGYYIHGTRSGTIRPGKYSHGCIRMNNKDLRQLVRMVEVGTMVYIY
ncbi:MAG: L,D-transpeptidase family protein [bacterium]